MASVTAEKCKLAVQFNLLLLAGLSTRGAPSLQKLQALSPFPSPASGLSFTLVTMSVEIVRDKADTEKVVLKDPQGASAELSLNGGQVNSWKNAQGEDLLFMSKKGKPGFFQRLFCNIQPKPPLRTISRGGLPIGILEFLDVSSCDKQEGWAGNRLWTIDPSPPLPPVNGTRAFVDLILNPTEDDLSSELRPKFEFKLRVALGVSTLTVTSRIRNIDTKTFKFTFVLRTFFPVSDISDVRIENLGTLNYVDNLKNGTICTEQESATIDGAVDRFYLSTPSKISIMDHGLKQRIYTLRKHGCPDAVLWNPGNRKSRTIQDIKYGDHKKFVCVGAAVIEDPVELQQGEEWKGVQEIRLVYLR